MDTRLQRHSIVNIDIGFLFLLACCLASASPSQAQARRASAVGRSPAVVLLPVSLDVPRVVQASAQVEADVPRPRRWVVKGALMGAVLGAAAGAYTMATSGCGGDSQDDGCVVAAVVLLTIGGAASGALLGALAEVVVPERRAIASCLRGRAVPEDPVSARRRLTGRCSRRTQELW